MPFEREELLGFAEKVSKLSLEEVDSRFFYKEGLSNSNPYDSDDNFLFKNTEVDEVSNFIRIVLDKEGGSCDVKKLKETLGIIGDNGEFKFQELEEQNLGKEEAKQFFYRNLFDHLLGGELFDDYVPKAKEQDDNVYNVGLFVKFQLLKERSQIWEGYEYKSFLGLVKKILEKNGNNVLREITGVGNSLSKIYEIFETLIIPDEFTQEGIDDDIISFLKGIGFDAIDCEKKDSLEDIRKKLGFNKEEGEVEDNWIKLTDLYDSNYQQEERNSFYFQRLLFCSIHLVEQEQPFKRTPFNLNPFKEEELLPEYSNHSDEKIIDDFCLFVQFSKLKEDEAIPKKYSKYNDFVSWVNRTIIDELSKDQEYTMQNVLDKIKEEIKKEIEKEKRKEEEASIKIQKTFRGRKGRNIAKEKREERRSASKNIDPIDAKSSSALEIPQIKGSKLLGEEKYLSHFKVFNYLDLNSFSEDFNAADSVNKSNWHSDKYLFSIVHISELDNRSERYCIVTSSSQGVTKSFISRAEFTEIVEGKSYLYDKKIVDSATETEIDNSDYLKEIASLYKQKKDLENALSENQEDYKKTSNSLAKLRIESSSLNDEEDHKSRNQDHDNQGEASTSAAVSLNEVVLVLNKDVTNPLHSDNTNESLSATASLDEVVFNPLYSADTNESSVSPETSIEEQQRSTRELENLTNKKEDLIKKIEDCKKKIRDSWGKIKDESQTGQKKPKSDNTSDKKSQTIVGRIKESIKNGFNHALDDSEVEGIAEDMAKAHKEAVYFYTEEKEDDCKKNVSELLQSNSPHNPLNGVSFLRPKGTKIVSVAFNYSEIGKTDNLNGSNEAYVYITGTDNCYVRCAVCQRDGEKMVVWKNGVASIEEHKRGDVVIDENTVSFLDEKTGNYTRVNASKSGLKKHLNSIKGYPGNENTIIDQLADLQIKVVSQIDSAMSGQEPDIESKVAIMYKGKSRSYNNRDDDKIVISRKKIAKTAHLTPHEDKKTKEVTANFVEINESNKISSPPISDEQFVKIHDISIPDGDGGMTITNLYAKIHFQGEKVIQNPNLFYDSGEGKMEALNAEVIKIKHSLSYQKASEMFDDSKRIGKNTKITFSNGKNRITSTILDEAKLPENKPSASPEPTSYFNCFGAALRSVGVR